ncbi:MAG: PGPGW domain-containing protein [Acidimicrobiia bacterium]
MASGDTQELPADNTQQLPRTIAIRQTRRILIAIVGGLVVAVGVAGFFLPILPGPLLILGGLTILSWEFYWARKLLIQLRERIRKLRRSRKPAPPGTRSYPSFSHATISLAICSPLSS